MARRPSVAVRILFQPLLRLDQSLPPDVVCLQTGSGTFLPKMEEEEAGVAAVGSRCRSPAARQVEREGEETGVGKLLAIIE